VAELDPDRLRALMFLRAGCEVVMARLDPDDDEAVAMSVQLEEVVEPVDRRLRSPHRERSFAGLVGALRRPA
jgi:hypothetical protein